MTSEALEPPGRATGAGAPLLGELTAGLREAVLQGDARTIRTLYDATFGSALGPRRLAGSAGPARLAARQWFEVWDVLLQERVFGSDAHADLARAILFPQHGGFPMGLLLLNAFWLEQSGSGLADGSPGLPAGFGSLPLDAQARALGATLTRTSARCPFDYAAVAADLAPPLLPALLLWFLGGYLVHPIATIDPQLARNRRRAIEGFVEIHRDRDVPLPPASIFGVASFASTSFASDPRAFLETLSERLLAPTLARARRKTGRGRKRKTRGGLGLLLSGWNESTAVYRCMNPLVKGMSREKLCGIQLGATDRPDASALPSAWRKIRLRAVAGGSVQELARAADQIRSLGLDFLMYPEVGLGNTRWLATQRLARVQATGYGHPVTTGSRAIDYFVGGAEIEGDGRDYRERLVLLPGLGVGSEVPLAPSAPRARPVDDREVVMATLASYNKMNQPLLQTWGSILRETGPGARLQMAAGLSIADCHQLAGELAPYFADTSAELKSSMPRQDCIDLLAEADIYLDSFPFNGYNSVVEALAAGCPVVTLESDHAYGRIAGATLRALALPDWLIARSQADYAAAVLRLVRDASLRRDLRAMLTRKRVVEALCGDEMALHFNAAVDWMREQGPRNPGPPVWIEAGEPPRERAGVARSRAASTTR